MENDNSLVTNKQNKQNKIKEFINKIFSSKRNKIILAISLFALVTLGGIIGYNSYVTQKHKEYETAFTKTTLDILNQTILCEEMTQLTSQTWHDAIFSNNVYNSVDFNTALANLHQSFQDKGTLKDRENGKNDIEKEMIKLQNPPKDYVNAYNLFVDLYSKYGQIYSEATNPQGSLTSYNNDTNTKSSEFSEIYDKIVVLKPEVKKK